MSLRPRTVDDYANTRSPRSGLGWLLVTMAAFTLVLASCGSAADTAIATADDGVEAPDGEGGVPEQDHDDDDHDDDDHDDDDHDDDDHDDDSSGIGAHEHGTADLSVAWIGSEIDVMLVSPSQNVFGFEYEAETEEDLATVAARTEAMTADGIVTPNESAGCELTEPARTDLEQDGSHSEITVIWAFSCEAAQEVSNLDLSALFAEFSGFEDIDAEWISDSNQSAVELTPDQPLLSFGS